MITCMLVFEKLRIFKYNKPTFIKRFFKKYFEYIFEKLLITIFHDTINNIISKRNPSINKQFGVINRTEVILT